MGAAGAGAGATLVTGASAADGARKLVPQVRSTRASRPRRMAAVGGVWVPIRPATAAATLGLGNRRSARAAASRTDASPSRSRSISSGA